MLGRHDAIEPIHVLSGGRTLRGNLGVPQGPIGVVVLAGTRGSSVAEALRARGLATVSLDLDLDALDARDDLDALAAELLAVTEWIRHSTVSHLPIGYLGADCYAAAAVLAATREPQLVRAIVAL